MRVLARNTTFAYKKKAADARELGRQLDAQYIVEGSFRRVADQISVTAQLIDTRTGTHVWAQTFDRPSASTSLLEIQDDIARRVGAAVGDSRTGALTKAELERIRDKPATELSSYECTITAEQMGGQQTLELMQRARTCAEPAAKRDPTYANVWVSLVRIQTTERFSFKGPDYLVPRIVEAANRAVELAPQSASAHLSLFFSYWNTCQPERMRVEAERVLDINPNAASFLLSMGYGLIITGEVDYGYQLAQKALSLAGSASLRYWWGALGDYHYAKGEYAEAAEAFRRTYSETSWVEHMRVMATLPTWGGLTRLGRKSPWC